MKVLLLGATGLLGHNVLLRLMEEGHQVVALVRRADGIHLPQGTWETVVGSLLDYNTLEKAAEGCDAIVNCAGTTDMSLRRYADYLPVNRDLCERLVMLMNDHGISVLVHASTVNTIGYGSEDCPADESAPKLPYPEVSALFAQKDYYIFDNTVVFLPVHLLQNYFVYLSGLLPVNEMSSAAVEQHYVTIGGGYGLEVCQSGCRNHNAGIGQELCGL